MLRKITFGLFALCFLCFAAFHIIQVRANGDPVPEMIPGASIRTEGTQGLRFSAAFDESLLGQTRGFFIIYGEATIQNLEAVLDHEEMVINGKLIKRVENYNDTAPTISVVLTGIPTSGYTTNITVFAYARTGEVYTFVPTGVIRSVAQVALNAARAGDAAAVQTVLNTIKDNYYIASWNDYGDFEISSSLFEINYSKIRVEFLADFNSVNNSSYNYDGIYGAGGTRHATFWGNEEMHAKWKWLAEFMLSHSHHASAISEWTAIVNQTAYPQPTIMWASRQDLEGFLTKTKCAKYSSLAAIDFELNEKYYQISAHNNSFYVSFPDYNFVLKGNDITLPESPQKEGYDFVHFTDGVDSYDELVLHTVSTLKRFSPIFNPITYDVTFYDELSIIPSLTTSYNIGTAISLPTYSKEGYVFKGWYENPEFTGSSKSTIPLGSTGHKEFYAKLEVVENVEVEVTYVLNGGYFDYPSKNDMIIDLLTDFYNYLEATESLSDFMHGVGNDSGFDGIWYSNTTYRAKLYGGPRPTNIDDSKNLFAWSLDYYEKWLPFFDMMDDFVKIVNNTQYFYGEGTSVGLIRMRQYVINVKPASYVSDETMAMMPDFSSRTGNVIETRDISGPMFTPVKPGYIFLGWYDNVELIGTPITTYPGFYEEDEVSVITYFAGWEEE